MKGRAQLGVQAFADALLIIPKVRIFTLVLFADSLGLELVVHVSFLNYVRQGRVAHAFKS